MSKYFVLLSSFIKLSYTHDRIYKTSFTFNYCAFNVIKILHEVCYTTLRKPPI